MRAAGHLKDAILFVHRWMGLIFCIPFLMWFASGVAMMYCDYPMVTPADRLNHLPPLNGATIRISPTDAYARLEGKDAPDEVHLITFAGRPAYRFAIDGGVTIVYADDGQTLTAFSPGITLQVASVWTGQPPSLARAEQNTTEDQWTVSGEFQALRPMRKYTWPDGEQVYVSTVTGDVAQYTTRASRLEAYLGPIPHWLYFTPLRKHGREWDRVVVYLSAVGTIVALIGIILGAWMYSPRKRFRYQGRQSGIPYAGFKRWHMALGLIFGVFACTWAFSGMLSMDPFPQWQSGGSDDTAARLQGALRGSAISLPAFAAKSPQQALAELGTDFRAKDLEFASFAGEPVYLASGALNERRVIPVQGEASTAFDQGKIVDVVSGAVQPYKIAQTKPLVEYDSYYLDRHGQLPLPVIFVQLDDRDRSTYYIDPKTALIVGNYDSRSRGNRWLYHGLHSINLPWLYSHRPAWDILVITLLSGGIFLSATSLILAWRVLRRKLRSQRMGVNRVPQPAGKLSSAIPDGALRDRV